MGCGTGGRVRPEQECLTPYIDLIASPNSDQILLNCGRSNSGLHTLDPFVTMLNHHTTPQASIEAPSERV